MIDSASAPPSAPARQRASGSARIALIAGADGGAALKRMRLSGASRAFMPRTHAAAPSVVLANTAGGLAGGDRFEVDVALAPGADASTTTQAAERAYRAAPDDPPAHIRTTLRLSAGARLAWLPHETIVFDGARLDRRLTATIASDARLLCVEMLVFGRGAMGETLRDGAIRDRREVVRDGRMVHADAFAVDAPIDARLSPPAAGAGARATATAIFAAPDAADALESALRVLDADAGVTSGASAWRGVLIARMSAADPARLRERLTALTQVLLDRLRPELRRA